ncbi:cold-regulated protein 27 [Lactuca sativa]|uniref:Uncharacterized protein n=1 Tax=Lactuca sativa TaxID=4236 RepID=A0A9R1V8J5_LACSA|nr:cold-regulated protein 27 [Lactuca sativa]KAJ0200171.1 hypothetical protein LSAT_V11C600340100 [Lactuca sativa]
MNVGLTWRHAMWKSYDIWHFYSLRSPNHLTKLFGSSSKSTTTAVSSSFSSLFGMEYTLPPPVTEAPPCSVASQMMGVEAGLSNFVEQEESSMMESPKISEWTDEKHNLYLNSMEASFVYQLYNSLDTRCGKTQNECFVDTKSSRKVHSGAHYPSGEFKVLQHGSWSRIDFRRENSVVNVADRPHVTSSNPWIQHFRKAKESISPQENGTLSTITQHTSYGNTEVIDQNFVEDSAIEIVTTPYNKKRKNTSAVSKLGNGQAASFWHLSCNGNGR